MKEVARVPVWAKLTPSTTDIVVEARGAFLGGVDAISSSNTFPSMPLIDPETLEFEMNVDGFVSSGGLGGPAILPLSLAKMAQLTQAFPDKAFSGIGGVAEFGHALNYFLLGCGTVQVCTAAMLDHAVGPNVVKRLISGMAETMDRYGWNTWTTSSVCAARVSSPTPRFAGQTVRPIAVAMRPKGTRPPKRRHAASKADRTCRTPVAQDFVELTEDVSASPLWNPDLAPTPLARRTWSTYHIAALWIGMSVVITTYTLASGLMQQGMTWWQAMITILLGNSIVLVPMILNAHAGTKCGVSFPVLCRASFGVKGANVPAILRALVACGWFGIQTWIGGLALHALLMAAWPAWTGIPGNVWIAFAVFWIVQVAIIVHGLEGIKKLEGVVGAAAARRRSAAAGVGGVPWRRPWSDPERVGAPADHARHSGNCFPLG